MQAIVKFDHVSKRYHLGVSRKSVLEIVSESVKKIYAPRPHSQQDGRILWALRDVSFDLRPGQCLGLVGRNGAGKSTILKLLANITRPSSGHIEINGRLSALIELGSGFHPDLTGRENVFLNGAVLGLPRSEIAQRFDEIVAFSEIEQFIDTPVKRYSSGMMVRLGFAVASCIEPEILLVDEVLAVGDASFRQKCLKRIQSLLQQGTSIIFVSHNLHMVQSVCPSSLYIHKGQVKLQGSTSDVIDAYERDLENERTEKLRSSGASPDEWETNGVEITEVAIEAFDGTSLGEMRNDRPVAIRVRYHARKPIERTNAVVRIVRSDGLTCCRMRTRMDEIPLQLSQGEGYFSIYLDSLQLIGASYHITASLWDELELVLLAEGESDWFSVSGPQTNDSEYAGIFEPQRRWIGPGLPSDELQGTPELSPLPS